MYMRYNSNQQSGREIQGSRDKTMSDILTIVIVTFTCTKYAE